MTFSGGGAGTALSKQSGVGRGTRKKKRHLLRQWLRRKTCVYCFIVDVTLFLAAIGGIAFIAFKFSNYKVDIAEAMNRHQSLQNRKAHEAYFHSQCPIYPKFAGPSEETYDNTYCNRYCGANEHMEFKYRFIPGDSIESGANCPNYVVLRSCQDRKSPNQYCDKKFFMDRKDYISTAATTGTGNELGVCYSC